MTFFTAEGNRYKDSIMATVLAKYHQFVSAGDALYFTIVLLVYFVNYLHSDEREVALGTLYLYLVMLLMSIPQCDIGADETQAYFESVMWRESRTKRTQKHISHRGLPPSPRLTIRRRKLRYTPQSSLYSLAGPILKRELTTAIMDNEEMIKKEIESLALLYFSVKDSKSWQGVLAAVVSYVKTHFETSLSSVIIQCLDDLFSQGGYSVQAGEQETEESTHWLTTLKMIHSDWKTAVSNEGFDKISRLLSLMIGAGLVSATSLQPDAGGMRLFSDLSVPKHVSAFDFADAIFGTIIHFVEGGYESMKAGSVRPLLYGEFDMRKFETDYLTCRKYAEYARPGNLSLLSIDENDLEKLYESTITLGKKLCKTVKNPIVKKQVLDRVTQLQDMHSTFAQCRQTGGVREKPYCIGIYGKTSVGKSTVGPLLMASSLVYNNFRADDEAIIVLNESDKYMSNYKSSINGVFLDDIGNTKSDFIDTAPTTRIIEIVNNVKMYANMAEADLKGKVSIQPKVVVCTTNVKDFGAHTYSNEPVSIARRANIVITATVKPQFAANNMLNTTLVEAYFAPNPVPDIPDLWNFKVEKAYPVPSKTQGQHDALGWKILVWNGIVMDDIDIKTLMKFLNLDSKVHFGEQKRIVANMSNLAQRLKFCPGCRAEQSICVCSESQSHVVTYIDSGLEKPEPQTHRRKITRARHKAAGRFVPHAGEFVRGYIRDWYSHRVAAYSWDAMYDRIEALATNWVASIANWTPAYWFENRKVRLFYAWVYGYLPFTAVYATGVLVCVTCCLIGSYLSYSIRSYLALIGFAAFMYIYFTITEYKLLMQTARDTRLGDRLHRWEISTKVKYILAGSAVLTTLYLMARSLRTSKQVFSTQGMMYPTEAEIESIDRNDLTETLREELNWAGVHVSQVPVSHKSKTTTSDDLVRLAQNNLTFVCTRENGKTYATNGFFVCSNVMLIPKHAWRADEMLVECVRHDKKKIGGNFRCYISRKMSIDIPDMDASLVWVPNGGSWRDLREFFPTEYPKSAHNPAIFSWKDDRGSVRSGGTAIRHGLAENGAFEFMGGHYTLPFDTCCGMCMGPLVSQTKEPYFAAFHLGGIEQTAHGCGGTILRSEIDCGIQQLKELPGVLLSASAGTMEVKKYGVQFYESPTIHSKSPINTLPVQDGIAPNMEVFGSCTGRASYYSEVVQSCISDTVTAVCGVANRWGGPAFRKGDPWLESLKYSCRPSHGVEGYLLSRAFEDYVRPLRSVLGKYHSLRNSTRPLQPMEIVCGIDGKKFIDKMPPNTSVGYPLSGPKRNFLTYLDPDQYEAFQCPAELDSMFWEEMARAEEVYLSGERYYPTFKACLKDEPTPRNKDKVRVFQAAPMVLQMLTRKYFLPIARILSLFPAVSECAVGVNCQGPDWHELAEHMRKFGSDRILAGDYSKYDLRMPAQVMFAAFRVLIELARECGYTAEDLTIMEGIATDICYPVTAYNGDLIQTIGSNPSGQNMTVYINSVVNSLLFRCAFYNLKGASSPLRFQEVCALMTYGDDAKGSVKSGHDDFNHIYCADFFAQHDMVFTMPDKTSEPVPFMRDAEADFLKRTNTYNVDLDLIMGALDEESIFKSLHSNLRSKALTPQQLAAANIDGALREWFNHGKEVYEKRRSQMQEVAKRAEITHMCQLLSSTYEDRLEDWKGRYVEGYVQQAGEYESEYDSDDENEVAARHYLWTLYGIVHRVMSFEDPDGVRSNIEIEDEILFEAAEEFDARIQRMDQLVSISLHCLETMAEPFGSWHMLNFIQLLSSIAMMAHLERVIQHMPLPAAAEANDCVEHYVYDFSQHCNGSTGLLSWEYPLAYKILGLPFMFYWAWLWEMGRIRLTVPTLRYYHFVVFWWLWGTGGFAFLFYSVAHALCSRLYIKLLRLYYCMLAGVPNADGDRIMTVVSVLCTLVQLFGQTIMRPSARTHARKS